jgi:hypothetical protein
MARIDEDDCVSKELILLDAVCAGLHGMSTFVVSIETFVRRLRGVNNHINAAFQNTTPIQ